MNVTGRDSRLRISTPGTHSTIAAARLVSGQLDVVAGSVAIDSIDSMGHVNVSTGSRVEFGRKGGKIGGEGMQLASGSTIASAGDLTLESSLISNGLVELANGTLSMRGSRVKSRIRGDGAVVGEQAVLEIAGGASVSFSSSSLTSTGLVQTYDSMIFFEEGMSSVLGGRGLLADGNTSIVLADATVGVSRLVTTENTSITVGSGSVMQLAGSLDVANASAIEGGLHIDRNSSVEFLLGLTDVATVNSTGNMHLGEFAELTLTEGNLSGASTFSVAGSLVIGAETYSRRRLYDRSGPKLVRISGAGGIQAQNGKIQVDRDTVLQLVAGPGDTPSDLGDISSAGVLELKSAKATISTRFDSAGILNISNDGILYIQAASSAASSVTTADLSGGGRMQVSTGGDLRLGRTIGGTIDIDSGGSVQFGKDAADESELEAVNLINRGVTSVHRQGLTVKGGRFAGNGSLQLADARLQFMGRTPSQHTYDGTIAAGTNSSLEIQSDQALELGGRLDSLGLVNLTGGGAMLRMGAGGSLRGSGVIAEGMSTLEIAHAVQVESQMRFGRFATLNVTGPTSKIHFSRGFDSKFDGPVAVGRGATFELAGRNLSDTVIINGNLASEGLVNVSSGQLELKKPVGRHTLGGAGLTGGSTAAISIAAGDVYLHGGARLDFAGRLDVSGNGSLRVASIGNVSSVVGELRSDTSAAINLDTGSVIIERTVLQGLTNTSFGTTLTFTRSASVLGPLSAAGHLEAPAGSHLAIGSSATEIFSAKFGGTLALEAYNSDVASPSGRRRLGLVSGHLTVGDGGMQSTGHVRVPSGSSLTFAGDGVTTIAGNGIDSAGTVTVASGHVSISSGGLRSDGAVTVAGGTLVLNATETSLIAGTGLSISGQGGLTIHHGLVDFRAPLEVNTDVDAVTIGASGSISFTSDSGALCETLNNCEDGVAASPINCSGSWGDWTDCSEPCGGGTQSRHYAITMQAQDGGSDESCDEVDGHESIQPCNTQGCPVDCLGFWSDPIDECSAPCGAGFSVRTYTVTTNAENGGYCETSHGSIIEFDCDAGPCDLCEDVSCSGNGFCSEGSCICAVGFAGVDCSTDTACSTACSSHGYCDGVSGTCVCISGYTGEGCETAPVDLCVDMNCGHGFCTADGDCSCLQGYAGPSCAAIIDGDGDNEGAGSPPPASEPDGPADVIITPPTSEPDEYVNNIPERSSAVKTVAMTWFVLTVLPYLFLSDSAHL